MIDSIYLGLSGMLGHERGLNVIGNNVSNLNTPAFRGSIVRFADVFDGGTQRELPDGRLVGQPGRGRGVDASRTALDMRAGDLAQTGRDLDVAIQGGGFFVVEDENGVVRYTRNGAFDFDSHQQLVLSGQKIKVMSLDAGGHLVPIDISGLQSSAAKATSKVSFNGILSTSSDKDHTIDALDVFDAKGGKHTLQLTFSQQDGTTTPGSIVWKVSALEGSTEVGSGTLEFVGSQISPDSAVLHLSLALKDTDPLPVDFDFSTVSSVPIGTTSTLAVSDKDGFTSGSIASETFDAQGTLQIKYSNGQTAKGPKLALAQIFDDEGLVQLGDSLFDYRGTQPVSLREAGADLQVQAQSLERSNVDLTQAFSDLILMQRGYQASSQVVSTANDMLQQLLNLAGGNR